MVLELGPKINFLDLKRLQMNLLRTELLKTFLLTG